MKDFAVADPQVCERMLPAPRESPYPRGTNLGSDAPGTQTVP
jgi:hypothetical protein